MIGINKILILETFEQQFILERWIFWEIFLRTHFDSGRSIGQESC